jgi:hypothetical protein
LAVDDNKIASLDVGKLTAGELNVGSFIQSTGYVEGEEGWKIHGNGFAEFGAASIRGQLTAAQIDSSGLTIRTAEGAVILNAGTSEFVGNVTGTIDGTDASILVTTANDAKDAAEAAQDAADAAQIDADSALTGLTTKLNSDARNVLAGAGGLATGTLNWNSSGVRTSGSGVGITQAGIVAYNSAGAATFVLNGTTGAATFAGALSAASGTFSGAVNVGSFTGYSWPAAGLGGAHLGANGLLLGNFNGGGKYFQIDSGLGSGNAAIYTNIPAFVDTLNIAGNAVTVPVSAFTATLFRNSTANTWQDAQTLTITTSGSRVNIFTGGLVTSGIAQVGDSDSPVTPVFRLLRGSTVLMEGWPLTYSETPAAGTYTYKIQVFSPFVSSSQSNGGLSYRFLFAIETKR